MTYVGISIDGLGAPHDRFRNRDGAFHEAMAGIRNCRDAGLKVGLRCTINTSNAAEIPEIFDLLVRENIPRICFYHLVCSGRGAEIRQSMLSHEKTRQTVNIIIDHTAKLHVAGHKIEVLTVDNLADGPYLYLRMLKENHPGADRILNCCSRQREGVPESGSPQLTGMVKSSLTGSGKPAFPTVLKGQPVELSDREKQVVHFLQGDIPVTAELFKDLANTVGYSEKELLQLLKKWQETGVLKRISGIIRHQQFGFKGNAMCVWNIPEEHIEATGAKLAEYSYVTHCYQREINADFPFNLYAMIHAGSREKAREKFQELEKLAYLKNGQIFFSTRELKKTSPVYF